MKFFYLLISLFSIGFYFLFFQPHTTKAYLNDSQYDCSRPRAGTCKAVTCTSNPSQGSAYTGLIEYWNNDPDCRNTNPSGVISQIESFTDSNCTQQFVGFCPERCKTNLSCGVGGICAASDYKDNPGNPETVEGICSRIGEAPYERKWCLEAVCGYKCNIANDYTCEKQGPGYGIGPSSSECQNGRTQPYLNACEPNNCPASSSEKQYQCSTVTGASSGPAGWTYEAGFSCGFGSGKGCFSKTILPPTCTGEIAGLNYECYDSCPSGWNSTTNSQLYTCSENKTCCVRQPINSSCIVGECDSCGGQFGTQTFTCNGGGGGVVSCVSNIPCPPGAPPPTPLVPPPSGSCTMSLVSTTSSSATVRVARSGGESRNYNRVNWYKDGVFVETQVVGGSTSENFTLPNKTIAGYTSGIHSAKALFWSDGGPGGNPNPSCQISFPIPVGPGVPGGSLTCCHIPGNIGRWSTDSTCPGGAAVNANFNTYTLGSFYRKGEGCFREPGKAYEPVSDQIGGNAWVVDVAGNMSRPNFGHYFYWIYNPTGVPYCILNTSFGGGTACISSYPDTWTYAAGGGDNWGQYSTTDGGMLYRHRTPSGQDSGVDKRFSLLDYDHSVDPIGFLTYTQVAGEGCYQGENGVECTKQQCQPLSQIYENWPSNRAKFYFWNSNLGSNEAGTATVSDSGSGSSHTGTLSLRNDLVASGTDISNINPNTGSALFCTSSTQTGEMGYVLGNARIDPVFRKNLQPPAEFSLTVESACSGEASPYMQLSWTPAIGASGNYLVYRQSDVSPTTQLVAVLDISQNSYTDLGAGGINQNYRYFVQAQNTDGCTRNDTPAGSCSSGGTTVTWKLANSGYCDSNPPILDDIVNLPTLPFCTVPDDRAAIGAKANRLWSNYQPIEVAAHDQDPNPSGIKQVVLTIRRDDSGATLYSGAQSSKGVSGYYEFQVSPQVLNSILLNTNEYTVSAQALDFSNNPSNVVSRYFQADSSCRCASIGAVGDVHGNTGIYISCED